MSRKRNRRHNKRNVNNNMPAKKITKSNTSRRERASMGVVKPEILLEEIEQRVDDAIHDWKEFGGGYDLLFIVKLEAAKIACEMCFDVLNNIYASNKDDKAISKMYHEIYSLWESSNNCIFAEDLSI